LLSTRLTFLVQENRVITTAHMPLTQELHVIRAHHLHYSSLLDDFTKNVKFVRNTPTPFMTSTNFPQDKIEENARLLERECKNLLDEIERLKLMLYQQERRLKNVMNLVRHLFTCLNNHINRFGQLTGL
jgi:hypothetical protein